jgi:hypothetical protein
LPHIVSVLVLLLLPAMDEEDDLVNALDMSDGTAGLSAGPRSQMGYSKYRLVYLGKINKLLQRLLIAPIAGTTSRVEGYKIMGERVCNAGQMMTTKTATVRLQCYSARFVFYISVYF